MSFLRKLIPNLSLTKTQDNFPLFYPSEEWNVQRFVRIHCKSCRPSPDGGAFTGSDSVRLKKGRKEERREKMEKEKVKKKKKKMMIMILQ